MTDEKHALCENVIRLEEQVKTLWKEVSGVRKWFLGVITMILVGLVVQTYVLSASSPTSLDYHKLAEELSTRMVQP